MRIDVLHKEAEADGIRAEARQDLDVCGTSKCRFILIIEPRVGSRRVEQGGKDCTGLVNLEGKI